MSIETLSKEIAATNAAFSISFDADKNINAWLIGKVADFLNRNGVNSLADLTVKFDKENPVEIQHVDGDVGFWVEYLTYDYRAYYLNKNTGRIVKPENPSYPYRDYVQYPLKADSCLLVTWTENKTYDFYLEFNQVKQPIFYVRSYNNESMTLESIVRDALQDFAPIAPIVLAATSLIIPGIGTAIGQAIGSALGIVDQTIIKYLGNFVLSTATNGGNVEKSAKSMVSSYIGSGIDVNVTGLTDSDLLGNVAGATVQAAMNGGNLQNAALMAVASNPPNLGNIMDDTEYENMGTDYSEYTDEISYTTDDGGLSEWDSDGNQTITYSDRVEIYNADRSTYTVYNDGSVIDQYGNYVDASSGAQTPVKIEPQSGMNVTFADILKAAPQIAQVWKSVSNPSPVRATRTTTANGSIVTPNKNGTITTITAQGKTSTTKMPVGVPYYFEDGSYVLVDQAGNVTNVSQTGQVTNSRVPSNVGGGGGGLLAAMGIGLLLLND